MHVVNWKLTYHIQGKHLESDLFGAVLVFRNKKSPSVLGLPLLKGNTIW